MMEALIDARRALAKAIEVAESNKDAVTVALLQVAHAAVVKSMALYKELE